MKSFWNQTSPRYRNFQIGFTLLTLNFAIPTVTYVFAPEVAHEQFVALNATLGGDPYSFPEHQSSFWRYLGAANVATLAFMCAFLQWDLRRNFAALVPLVFMKSMAATLWLGGFIAAESYYPAFLAAAVLDYVTSAAFVWFAKRARDDIDDLSDSELIPTPAPARALQRNVSDRVLRLFLPSRTPIEPNLRPAFSRPNARRLSLGLAAASWFVVAASIVRHGRSPWKLADPERKLFVDRLSKSPVWWVRQLVEIVKLSATLAYELEPSPNR